MKIAFLTHTPANGGSAATAYHNVRLLRQAGQEAVLFAPGGYWAGRGKADGVPVDGSLELRRGFRPLSFFRDFRRLRAFLKANGTDVVAVQKSPEQWLAYFVLMTLGRKIALVRLRGVVFAIRPGFFNRRLHNAMQAVICSAGVIAEQYRALPGFDPAHVTVLLEGIDTQAHRPATGEERAAARKRLDLDPEALYLGTAGRPAPVKGHDVLVEAFALALKDLGTRGAKARLAVFADESRRGPGSYESLQELCNRHGVADFVDLRPGYLDDIRDVYRALDAYVLPSRGSEGSSRAGLEACAHGLLLVASRVGVLPDLVEDGKTGILVPPGDPAALSGVLAKLIGEWPAARALGDAARERIEAQFREDDYAKRLVAILEGAVAKKNN